MKVLRPEKKLFPWGSGFLVSKVSLPASLLFIVKILGITLTPPCLFGHSLDRPTALNPSPGASSPCSVTKLDRPTARNPSLGASSLLILDQVAGQKGRLLALAPLPSLRLSPLFDGRACCWVGRGNIIQSAVHGGGRIIYAIEIMVCAVI